MHACLSLAMWAIARPVELTMWLSQLLWRHENQLKNSLGSWKAKASKERIVFQTSTFQPGSALGGVNKPIILFYAEEMICWTIWTNVTAALFRCRLVARMLARYGPQMSGSVSFVTNNIIIMQYVYIYIEYLYTYIMYIYNINEVCS